jgi:uncharacterized protein
MGRAGELVRERGEYCVLQPGPFLQRGWEVVTVLQVWAASFKLIGGSKVEWGYSSFLSSSAGCIPRKHGLNFESATTVFRDPLAVTSPMRNTAKPRRWITLGKDARGHYTLVIHTFEWLADNRGRVRLISARRPTKKEIRDYEEQA